MACCENPAIDASRRRQHVRILCVFITTLISNKILLFNNPAFNALLNDVDAFCVTFSDIREASELLKQIRKISSDGCK
jgi:hypothetical protein